MRYCGSEFQTVFLIFTKCKGLKIEDHFGNFYMRNSTDLELAGIDSLKSYGVCLKHDSKLEERGDSYIQAALLYTTSEGQRRIRIHNLAIGHTTTLSNVFKSADLDTIINYLSKMSISMMSSISLKQIREKFEASCVKVLSSYRLNCASVTAAGQVMF